MGGTPARCPTTTRRRPDPARPRRLPRRGASTGADDEVVPREQSTAYVAAAEDVGATVSFTEVPGSHAEVIDPTSEAWPTILELLA